MKKSFILAIALGSVLVAGAASAVKLVNSDGDSYDITIDCNGSRSSSSISGSSTRDLGDGPCTVTLSNGSSGSASGSSTMTISGGSITVQ